MNKAADRQTSYSSCSFLLSGWVSTSFVQLGAAVIRSKSAPQLRPYKPNLKNCLLYLHAVPDIDSCVEYMEDSDLRHDHLYIRVLNIHDLCLTEFRTAGSTKDNRIYRNAA